MYVCMRVCTKVCVYTNIHWIPGPIHEGPAQATHVFPAPCCCTCVCMRARACVLVYQAQRERASKRERVRERKKERAREKERERERERESESESERESEREREPEREKLQESDAGGRARGALCWRVWVLPCPLAPPVLMKQNVSELSTYFTYSFDCISTYKHIDFMTYSS